VTPRPGELESVACNLCGSTAAEPVYDFSPLHIVRCRVCDLVYTSPRLTQSEIESRLYGPDYWEAYERQYVEALPAIREFARHWLTTLGRFAASDRWRLFELGPGLGAFLAEARDAGHEVYGADISEHAIARARERFGLEVVHAGADQLAQLELPPLDVFVMEACIEHLPDPLAALRTAHEQLVPGGLLFLSTGVFGSFNQRFAGKRWGIIEPEAHLYYFSKDTIRQALELAGFDLLLLETNELLVNPTTRSLLAPLFNNRVTQFLRFGALVRRLRLGDEMFVVTRKRS
jgi:SAM-dependent methyltransferase